MLVLGLVLGLGLGLGQKKTILDGASFFRFCVFALNRLNVIMSVGNNAVTEEHLDTFGRLTRSQGTRVVHVATKLQKGVITCISSRLRCTNYTCRPTSCNDLVHGVRRLLLLSCFR